RFFTPVRGKVERRRTTFTQAGKSIGRNGSPLGRFGANYETRTGGTVAEIAQFSIRWFDTVAACGAGRNGPDLAHAVRFGIGPAGIDNDELLFFVVFDALHAFSWAPGPQPTVHERIKIAIHHCLHVAGFDAGAEIFDHPIRL